MLVDVRPFGVTGKEADAALGEVRITVNKNTIPYDPEPPMVGSGIRVGTPAVTRRGMREEEMREIGDPHREGIAARVDRTRRRRCAPRGGHRRPLPGARRALNALDGGDSRLGTARWGGERRSGELVQ